MITRYKFCLWLVNKLSMHRMTLAEITDHWSRSDSNISGDILTPRTFLRYKALAEEIFNVNIECHKPTNEYWLNMDALDESYRWIMSALQVQNLSDMSGMRQHIILEGAPAGQDLLETVANACRDNLQLSFSYKSPYH